MFQEKGSDNHVACLRLAKVEENLSQTWAVDHETAISIMQLRGRGPRLERSGRSEDNKEGKRVRPSSARWCPAWEPRARGKDPSKRSHEKLKSRACLTLCLFL